MNAMSYLALPLRRQFAGRSAVHHRWVMGLALVFMTCASGACEAQCVEQANRVPAATLQAFQTDPSSLLRELRNDRSKLASRLSAYIVTDISVLPAVRDLIKESTNADRGTIGASLRQAQLICLPHKAETARKISEFVQKLEDSAVSSGYSAELETMESDTSSVASQPIGNAPPRSADRPAGNSSSLMTGEWQTDIADPFAPEPLPH